MRSRKLLIVWLVLGIWLLAWGGEQKVVAAPAKLDRVVYITLSKACSCNLVLCQAGDIIVGNVFTGARKELLKRLDYSTDREAARVYLKQYGITQAPAILFLDTQGKLLWMALGELSEKDIQEKLRVLGN